MNESYNKGKLNEEFSLFNNLNNLGEVRLGPFSLKKSEARAYHGRIQ
jgi:hypothetical protein